jgi:hypothetical protein
MEDMQRKADMKHNDIGNEKQNKNEADMRLTSRLALMTCVCTHAICIWILYDIDICIGQYKPKKCVGYLSDNLFLTASADLCQPSSWVSYYVVP